MNPAIYVLISVVIVAAAAHFLFRVGRAYFKLRGKRLVTCPETKQPAAVDVDAAHAAREAIFGSPHLRLSECSRWPERRGCGQECLRQIESAPQDCLVRKIVREWYTGKTCAYCGKPITEVHEWANHHPALMTPGRATIGWDDVPPENLPALFASHLPVCWSCHIAETFRRQHPDLVTDRPPRW
jgi:hypothetical protein